MTLEELSNLEVLQLFKNIILQGDEAFALEIQEEIFSRMEENDQSGEIITMEVAM